MKVSSSSAPTFSTNSLCRIWATHPLLSGRSYSHLVGLFRGVGAQVLGLRFVFFVGVPVLVVVPRVAPLAFAQVAWLRLSICFPLLRALTLALVMCASFSDSTY